jgi:hypothetical protein
VRDLLVITVDLVPFALETHSNIPDLFLGEALSE